MGGACQNSTGSSSGTPASRNDHGRRSANSSPPSTPATPAHPGACAKLRLAHVHCAKPRNNCAISPMAPAARSHSGWISTPSMASGVTTSVTHGIASALASSPTSDTWPNNSRLNGVSASVMTHCSRINTRNLERRRVAPVCELPASLANSTPTATKLNQKPACSNAHGSTATTTAQASSQTCGQGQRTPSSRSVPTVASISTVRCAGTPQPLNKA